MHDLKNKLLLSIACVALATTANAATYYVIPPEDTSTEGDQVSNEDSGTEDEPEPKENGSIEYPWTSISTALASVSGGDTILLASGDYGPLDDIVDFAYTSRVTLEALDHSQPPKFHSIYINNSNNLRFSHILVQPNDYTAETKCDVDGKSKALVCIDNGSSSITIEKSVIDSGESLEELSALDLEAQDQGTYTYENSNLQSFFDYQLSGIAVWNRSNDILISNNKISNLSVGIQLNDIFYATVSGNYIASIRTGVAGKKIDDIDIDDNYFKHFYSVLGEDDKLRGGSGILLSYGYEELDVIKDVSITNNVILPYDLSELDNTESDNTESDNTESDNTSTIDRNKTFTSGIYHLKSRTQNWTIEHNIVAAGQWNSFVIDGIDQINLRYNLEVDMNPKDQTQSHGIKISYENEYDSDKVDISCNIASKITEDGLITTNDDILSQNTISTFVHSGDWATDANNKWPSNCAVELGYKLITKDI